MFDGEILLEMMNSIAPLPLSTYSSLEKVLTQTNSLASHKLTNASALPTAKYLEEEEKQRLFIINVLIILYKIRAIIKIRIARESETTDEPVG